MPHHQNMPEHASADMQQCIRNCSECHRVCTATLAHCLEMGGKHAEKHHITLLIDCAQICHTSADFMLRESELHHITCGACAEICERCATDCEQMAEGDEQMLACAEMCRVCATSCRKMASIAA